MTANGGCSITFNAPIVKDRQSFIISASVDVNGINGIEEDKQEKDTKTLAVVNPEYSNKPTIWPAVGMIGVLGIHSDANGPNAAVDIIKTQGTPVVAPFDGVVTSMGYNSLCGWGIQLQNDKYRARFCHIQLVPPSPYNAKKGEKITEMGGTWNGDNDAPQVHYSFVSLDPNNPAWYGPPYTPFYPFYGNVINCYTDNDPADRAC